MSMTITAVSDGAKVMASGRVARVKVWELDIAGAPAQLKMQYTAETHWSSSVICFVTNDYANVSGGAYFVPLGKGRGVTPSLVITTGRIEPSALNTM